MTYLNHKQNYDKNPMISISKENKIFEGYSDIVNVLKKEFLNKTITLAIECYPGVRYKEINNGMIEKLNPKYIACLDDFALDISEIDRKLERFLTNDRVFGFISPFEISEFYNSDKLESLKQRIQKQQGLKIVYGFGVSTLIDSDYIIYVDVNRWEIQQRYRSNEIGNWLKNNYEEDILKKYKRAYFIEWRIADKIKDKAFDIIDYYIDSNTLNTPKMIKGKEYLAALDIASKKPFRLVPYFDPGIWGGQWMKEVCDLDKEKENFAWSFDGVPEENSINLKFGENFIQSPAMNLVLYKSTNLLGSKVRARFGKEFPIRFDFLDAVKGQNLSLQVHPLTEYIQKKFGMHYTQDESYYILHAEESSSVYLGTKDNISSDDMIKDLQIANKGGKSFDAEKYINKLPAKTHDHFLIPAGTIHCSGSGTMVLEISATPYIFTFKLWDWDRLGLDGRPRPIHIEHGKEVIQWDRKTSWIKKNLVNRIELLHEDTNYIEERTGLHELEFIETRRYWIKSSVTIKTGGGVNVLNLIQGEKILVHSKDNLFDQIEIHYAETFIVPAYVNEYSLSVPEDIKDKKIGVIRAFVRT